MLDNRAWSIRGPGFAYTVKPRNWKPFAAYIEKARVYLEKTKAVSSSDPYWYQLMADVATAQSWPDKRFDRLLWEGLKREPLFYELYFAAIRHFAPRWHGNDFEIEVFALKAVHLTKAVEGDGMYARLYWYASQFEYGNRLFAESMVVWPLMKKGIDDVLRKYPDAWNLNNFAKFACLYEDKAKTAELMTRIGDTPMHAVWGAHPSREPSFEACKSWAAR